MDILPTPDSLKSTPWTERTTNEISIPDRVLYGRVRTPILHAAI